LNHKVIRVVVALAFGGALAMYTYSRIADPLPRLQRAEEEAVVLQAGQILKGIVAPDSPLELVDPLNPDRVIGKVYIYPTAAGWAISGHYRRNKQDRWHPWLMTVDESVQLKTLSVQDSTAELVQKAATDPRFDAMR